MVLPQPKIHQVTGKEVTPYDLMQSQLGNKALLDKLAGLPILDGVLLEDLELDYSAANLVEHKLGRKYRGFVVVRRQVPPCAFLATTPVDTSIATGASETLDFGTDVYDDGGDHAAGIFTAPVDGIYQFEASLIWADTIADTYATELSLWQNASTYVADQTILLSAAFAPVLQVGARVRMAADDTMRARIFHNDAATPKAISTSTAFTWFRGWLVDNGIAEDKDWLDDTANDPSKFLPLRCSFDHTVSLWVF